MGENLWFGAVKIINSFANHTINHGENPAKSKNFSPPNIQTSYEAHLADMSIILN
jgi:hypothetical protein